MSDAQFTALRTIMVQEILAHAQLAREQLGKDTLAPSVMDALGRVPRHDFVPLELRQYAYAGLPAPDRLRQDHLPALHRGAHDRSPRGRTRRQGA